MIRIATDDLVRVRITPDLLAIFDHHSLHSGKRGHKRWELGEDIQVSKQARIEPYSHILSGSVIPLALGAFSYTAAPASPAMRIARYSSIARGVAEIGAGHPTDWVTSSPFSHHPQPLGGFRDYLVAAGVSRFDLHDFDAGTAPIEIGNDVWIGEMALLKPGVKIGDGAIVATRAIVTRDVPAYAIVGGSPARLIRYRFNEALIEQISQTEWWRYGPDILQPLDVRDPARFPDRLYEAVEKGAKPLDLRVLTGEEIIAAGEAVA